MRNIADIIADDKNGKKLSQTERQIAVAYIQGKYDAVMELKISNNSNINEVLDKISAEIKEMTPTYHNPDWSITDLVPISKVLKLIDKYKTDILKELPPVTPKCRCSENLNKSEIPTGSTTKDDLGARKFEGIEVTYPPEDACAYPEYKGKPYFGIRYKENGEEMIGYGTYNPEILSQYLKDYFISTTKNDLVVDAVSRKELLKIYEDRFLELQKLKHLKDNKGAEDRQMGINYCINILKELSSVTPQESRWIPMVRREPTDEEKAEYLAQNGEELGYMLENEMPLNGQEVLVSVGEVVSEDIFDEEFFNFESNDIENVDAWMPLPKAYEPQESEDT